jgi:hypothetical protein
MTDKIQVKELASWIVRDLNLEEEGDQPEMLSTDDIKHKLTGVIKYLLQYDFSRLLNAMYRLDIDEKSFNEVLDGLSGADVPARLADLVIEREMQKIATRKIFKESKPD